MPIIENGYFSSGLDHWEVLPEYWTAPPANVRIASSDAFMVGTGGAPRESLYVELGRWISIRQTFPTGAITDSTHFYMAHHADAASFYINLQFEDGIESTHFYGHWPDIWQTGWYPMSMGRNLLQFEILIQSAVNLYIDNILVPGDRIEPKFGHPMRANIPEEIDELRRAQLPLEHRMLGIERGLLQMQALLAQQQDPDINKRVKKALKKQKKFKKKSRKK
jgi:hypothetical protein